MYIYCWFSRIQDLILKHTMSSFSNHLGKGQGELLSLCIVHQSLSFHLFLVLNTYQSIIYFRSFQKFVGIGNSRFWLPRLGPLIYSLVKTFKIILDFQSYDWACPMVFPILWLSVSDGISNLMTERVRWYFQSYDWACPMVFPILWLSVSDEGFSRNASCALI